MIVLDSYALLAYLEDEKGAETIESLLKAAEKQKQPLLMSVINWSEVYYIVLREKGEKSAEGILYLIDQLPVEIVPCDRKLSLRAARLKAKCSIAYADCFCAALALETGSKLITGDPEFNAIEHEVKIQWLPGKK